jgi:hypothetical protein
MSGGWPSQAEKRAGWCGPEPLFLGATTRRAVFPPLILHGGLALTAWGPQARLQMKKNSQMAKWLGTNKNENKKRQPQERQHSDGEAVTLDRLPP